MIRNSIYVYGKNSVIEYLDSGKQPRMILMRKGIRKDNKIKKIIDISYKHNIYLEYTQENELNRMTKNSNHQGVVIIADKPSEKDILSFEDLIDDLDKEERSCIALLDSVQDIHNMGAIIRSAEFFGVSAIIVPEKGSAPINETVHKTSSGAVEHMKIARVNNLNYAIEILKQSGYWIYGTYVGEGQKLCETKFDKKCAIVLGSESKGMKKSLKDNCDFLVFINRIGNIDSLNVSVSAGVVFYEYAKQQLSK